MWFFKHHSQQSGLVELFALTGPFTLQTKAGAVGTGGSFSTTAYLLGPALVAHLIII